jgi:hypothetical protein
MGFRQDLLISPFSCPEQRLHTGFVFTCFGLLLILVLFASVPYILFYRCTSRGDTTRLIREGPALLIFASIFFFFFFFFFFRLVRVFPPSWPSVRRYRG